MSTSPLSKLLAGLESLISSVKGDIEGTATETAKAGTTLAAIETKIAAPIVTAATDIKAIGQAGWNYIMNNGLQDAYNIATAALLGAATGTPVATIEATVVSQSLAAGKSIASAAEQIVVAQAKADLQASQAGAPANAAALNVIS